MCHSLRGCSHGSRAWKWWSSSSYNQFECVSESCCSPSTFCHPWVVSPEVFLWVVAHCKRDRELGDNPRQSSTGAVWQVLRRVVQNIDPASASPSHVLPLVDRFPNVLQFFLQFSSISILTCTVVLTRFLLIFRHCSSLSCKLCNF